MTAPSGLTANLIDLDGQLQKTLLIPPFIACALMALIAAVTTLWAQIDVRPLLSYFECATVTLICTLVYVFIELAKLSRVLAPDPFATVKQKVACRLWLLLLPSLILPAFLIGYTAAKSAIPVLVGYTWDGIFANADRLIFGNDAWRLAWSALGASNAHELEWIYSVGWGSVFLITANCIALYGNKRLAGVYFTAMLATWLIGGCALAYTFSAAGPAFAPTFEPSLKAQFQPLNEILARTFGHTPIGLSQRYLVQAAHVRVAEKGGGISAMPSMHLGTTTIYVLAARKTKWLLPAITFWLTIFVLSAYFGFHYWVDGIAAAAVATFCWMLAEWSYRRIDYSSAATAKAGPVPDVATGVLTANA